MNSNTNSNTKETYLCRVKYYADTPMERNKYFCYNIRSILDVENHLFKVFDKGWHIRAAYFENIDQSTGEIIENTKINLKELILNYGEKKISNLK